MNFFLVVWHTLDTLITPHQLFHINNIFVCVLNEMKGSWYDTAMFGSEKKNSSLLVACYYYYISNTFRRLVMSSWHYMYCHYYLRAKGTDDRKEKIKWKQLYSVLNFGTL